VFPLCLFLIIGCGTSEKLENTAELRKGSPARISGSDDQQKVLTQEVTETQTFRIETIDGEVTAALGVSERHLKIAYAFTADLAWRRAERLARWEIELGRLFDQGGGNGKWYPNFFLELATHIGTWGDKLLVCFEDIDDDRDVPDLSFLPFQHRDSSIRLAMTRYVTDTDRFLGYRAYALEEMLTRDESWSPGEHPRILLVRIVRDDYRGILLECTMVPREALARERHDRWCSGLTETSPQIEGAGNFSESIARDYAYTFYLNCYDPNSNVEIGRSQWDIVSPE